MVTVSTSHSRIAPLTALLLFAACSSGEGEQPFGQDSGSLPTGSETGATASDGDSQGAGEGQEDSEGQGASGDSSDAGDAQEPSDSSVEGDEGEETGDEPRFDVGISGDVAGEIQPWGEPDEMRSFIWIANSEQGSISKIDTETMIEEGRFLTAAEPNNPSRSSVDLNGSVAVAGRGGGIIKIHAAHHRCKDSNGSGGISTSLSSEMLEWGKDECVDWYVDTAYEGQRAVAWTQGIKDPDSGDYYGQNLWVSSFDMSPTFEAESYLYDGTNGDELGVVKFQKGTVTGGSYGGAVDSRGNFWTINYGGGYLLRADVETFQGTHYPIGHHSYGMTIDPNDNIWTCSSTIARFDPRTLSWRRWDFRQGNNDFIRGSELGGCMVDQNGVLWHSGRGARDGSFGIFGFDTNSFEVVNFVSLPEHSHGIAVDFHGYVWGIPLNTDHAMRVDTRARNYKTFEGLVGAYTYSDMTGFTLYSTLPPVAD